MPRFYSDLKFWVFLGILAGLGIGFDAERPGDFLMVALIFQMTVSLEGLVLRRSDMSEYRGSLVVSLLCGFGINTLMTLFMGSFFIGDKALWYGWVVLASVPCGISLIAEAIFNDGDVKFSFLALTISYFTSLLFTPFLTYIIIGEAADPFVILRYIILFLAIPFAMTFPLRKVGLGSRKTMLINFFTFFIVYFALGSNRDYILDRPEIVGLLALACIIRIFGVHLLSMLVFRKMGIDRGRAVVYSFLNIMKNSGMSATIALGLFGSSMPEVALPCAVSLLVEFVCFAVSTSYMRNWYSEGKAVQEVH